MKRPSLLAIFVAGMVLGVVLSAVVLQRLMTSGEAAPAAPAARAPAAVSAAAATAAAGQRSVPASNVARPRVAPSASAAAAARESAAGGTPPGEIRIDPAMLQNLGVRTVEVEPRLATEPIRTTGYVDYDQRLVTQVNARVSGWIEKLYVAYLGQPVRRGEVLLRIYSPELVLTQEDYLRARRLATRQRAAGAGSEEGQARSDGSDLMSAAETRLRLWGIAPSELRKLAKSGKPSESLPLESPASGVVTESKVIEGAHVRAGEELYTIADLSRVWVYADIYERELPMVRTGQHAEVSVDGLPGRRFDGVVTYIYPSVNEQSRTVRVRLEFSNPGLALRPGMYVKATLLHRASAPTLAVPAEAVLDSGVRRVVIVALGHGHFAPREIKVGTQSEGYFQVLHGLRRGERVVISAQFLIDSESNLSEALNAMNLAPSPGAPPSSPVPRVDRDR